VNNEDLKVLRTPLIILAAVITVVAGAGWYTHTLVIQSKAALVRQNNDLQSAKTRMRQSGDEKETIVKYVDRYRELETIGFAGEEQRINWLDALRNANAAAGLFGIGYQIGTQHSYPYAAELDPGAISLQESIMELDMSLLHEGDLARFFETLRAQRVGLFQVRECTLTRTDKSDTLRNQAYLSAKCDLAWITAKPAAATGVKR
jgi:hypothetical protein